MNSKSQLVPTLKALQLSGSLERLDVRIRQAIDDKLSYVEFLERLLEDGVERCGQKQLLLRLPRALFNVENTLDGFDWTFIPRQQPPGSVRSRDLLPDLLILDDFELRRLRGLEAEDEEAEQRGGTVRA